MAQRRIDELVSAHQRASERAGVHHAVIGGCTVAAWVATRDHGAVRATKDVDVLLARGDLLAADLAARTVGLYLDSVDSIPVLPDVNDPRRSPGSPRLGRRENGRARTTLRAMERTAPGWH